MVFTELTVGVGSPAGSVERTGIHLDSAAKLSEQPEPSLLVVGEQQHHLVACSSGNARTAICFPSFVIDNAGLS